MPSLGHRPPALATTGNATTGIGPLEGLGEGTSGTSLGKDPAQGPGIAGGGNVPSSDTGWWAGWVLAGAQGLEGWGWRLNRQLVLL